MNDVHGRVGEDLVEGFVRPPNAQGVRSGGAALGGAAEDAPDIDPDPTKLLDVDGANETGSDDRGTDLAELAHPTP